MAKKVKGYGLYWAGHIKNKSIARKNKQYIKDQRYLSVYKKFIKGKSEETDGDLPGASTEHPDVHTNDHNSHDEVTEMSYHDSEAGDVEEESPVTIKPQIESVYLYHEDEEPTDVAREDPEPQNTEDKGRKEQSTGKKPKGVYAKALKKRQELENEKKKREDERIEEIKRRKREIREKKQLRYERHRLLGTKTKKGQPIMANVVKFLMKKHVK